MTRERGYTLVELAVAATITLGAMLLGAGMFVDGLEGARNDAGSWSAMTSANRALDTISRDLRDASFATVVLTTTQPDRITFQRCRGHNPSGKTDAEKRLLTPPITYRRAAVPGKPGEFAVERVEGTDPPVRIATYCTALTFRMEKFNDAIAGVVVELTVQPPGGKALPTSFRLASQVAIEAP